jgi:hypothetical protein
MKDVPNESPERAFSFAFLRKAWQKLPLPEIYVNKADIFLAQRIVK